MKRPSWNAPWWAWSLFYGPLFGVGQGAWAYADGRYSVVGAVVFGVFEGLFFGAIMGPATARRMRRQSRSVGEVPYDQQRAVAQGGDSWAGPARPLRTATRRRGWRPTWPSRPSAGSGSTSAVFAIFAALSVYLSVAEAQPAWLVSTLFWSGLAVWAAVLPRHYRHRSRLLDR